MKVRRCCIEAGTKALTKNLAKKQNSLLSSTTSGSKEDDSGLVVGGRCVAGTESKLRCPHQVSRWFGVVGRSKASLGGIRRAHLILDGEESRRR